MSSYVANLGKYLVSKMLSRTANHDETLKAELGFYISYLLQDMTVFDVGANCGDITLIFSSIMGNSGVIHAFEPGKGAFDKLSKVVHILDRENVVLNNLAVSDHTGTSQLYVYDEQHSSWNSLAPRPLEQYGIDVHYKEKTDVKTITIDDYCSAHNIARIDLLKIDVEGAEYQVLLGAERMLSAHAVRRLTFEYGATTYDMGNRPEQIEAFLLNHGYEIRNVVWWAPNFPGRKCAKEAQFSVHIAEPIS